MRPSALRFLATLLVLVSPLSVWGGGAPVCQDVLLSRSELEVTRFLRGLDHHSLQQWNLALQLLGKSLSSHILENYPNLSPAESPSILSSLEGAGFLNRGAGLPEPSQLNQASFNLLNHFMKKKAIALQLGQITQDQAIEPGFVFSNSSGDELKVLPFGATVPRGYSLHLNTHDLLNGTIFTEFLGSGYQVVQVSVDSAQNWMSYHDIAHLFGYYSEPEYMAAVRTLAREVDDPSRMRNFYLFEIFAWVNRQKLEEFERQFNLAELRDCQNSDCIQELIYENGKVKPHIFDYLRTHFHQLLSPLGGSLLSHNLVIFMGEPGLNSAPYHIAHQWLNTGKADLFVEYLYQMIRTDIASHVELLKGGPSAKFCGFYYQFALHSRVWNRLCPTHF